LSFDLSARSKGIGTGCIPFFLNWFAERFLFAICGEIFMVKSTFFGFLFTLGFWFLPVFGFASKVPYAGCKVN
jgi:hypothetical protein